MEISLPAFSEFVERIKHDDAELLENLRFSLKEVARKMISEKSFLKFDDLVGHAERLSDSVSLRLQVNFDFLNKEFVPNTAVVIKVAMIKSLLAVFSFVKSIKNEENCKYKESRLTGLEKLILTLFERA